MTDRSHQIVEAARALLEEDPRSSLAVRKVAERAGIGATTLRHYFPTQRSLREAILVESFRTPLGDERIHDASLPAEERLHECLRQLLPPSTGKPLSTSGWLDTLITTFGEPGSSVARLAWEGRVTEHVNAVTRWLTILSEEGLFRSALRGRVLFLLACVDGLAVSRLTFPLASDQDEETSVLRSAIRAALAESF